MFPTIGSSFSILRNNMTKTTQEYCGLVPPQVNSFGIWRLRYDGELKPYAIPVLELQMAVIFFITQAFQFLLMPFRLPKFTSQLLVRVRLYMYSIFYLNRMLLIVLVLIFLGGKILGKNYQIVFFYCFSLIFSKLFFFFSEFYFGIKTSSNL